MNDQFEGSIEQRRILKLREVEGPLARLKLTASLLSRCAHADDIEAVDSILEDAETALARLGEVER